MTRRKLGLLITPALLLSACNKTPPAKRYPMRGVVKALDPQAQVATIDSGKIDDWMEAMTMEFPVKPPSEFQKLQVGQKISATVVVDDLKYYVTDIKVQ